MDEKSNHGNKIINSCVYFFVGISGWLLFANVIGFKTAVKALLPVMFMTLGINNLIEEIRFYLLKDQPKGR